MSQLFESMWIRTAAVLRAVLQGAMRSALLLTEAAARQKIILAGYDAPVGTRALRQRLGQADASPTADTAQVTRSLRLH
jgi:hypothetical protein